MSTNITKHHRQAFEALSSGNYENFALLSCFVGGALQGLYDISRKLQPYGEYRAKWATLYLTVIDEDGKEVLLDQKGEWELYPYKSAADEAGV